MLDDIQGKVHAKSGGQHIHIFLLRLCRRQIIQDSGVGKEALVGGLKPAFVRLANGGRYEVPAPKRCRQPTFSRQKEEPINQDAFVLGLSAETLDNVI